MPSAIITGASRGLGLALARALAREQWALAIDARGTRELGQVARELGKVADVVAVAGDLADPDHRRELVAAAGEHVDLLVNNASTLGPSPRPALAQYPLGQLERVFEVNLFAPLALTQLVLPRLLDSGVILNVTSDAAVEPYRGWGGYGASKAALEQLTAILGAEHPGLKVYAVDPGDMRTRMHQEAFPGEDISDRPPPEQSVAGLLVLVSGTLPSGRYRARELTAVSV